MNTKEEELYKILEEARDASQEAFNKAPSGLGFKEFESYMEESNRAVGVASRAYRMIKTPIINDDVDTIGDKMTLKAFIKCCKCGGFIDYDGFGYYSVNGKASNITINPSDVKHDCIRKDFKEIIWYNR